jgi:hypothetical protein
MPWRVLNASSFFSAGPVASIRMIFRFGFAIAHDVQDVALSVQSA